jgi:hypothetical protein
MKQRKFFTKLILLGLIVSIGFVGCKNYDDQIDDLKGQISEVQKTVNDLKAKVDAGSVITKVESTGNGIKITLSDGTTHNITNGAAGATGAAGAPGSVVTIGSNGNWFIDGKDTGKPSVGAQGPAGPQGPAGIYYIPNADGYWYKVENGVATKTNDKWQLPGIITALWDGKSVTLYGVKDASGNVVDGIVLGLSDLRSIVLIPDFVTPEGFPVVNFGTLTSAKCKTITPKLVAKYRLNPSNADVNNIKLADLAFNYNGPTTITRSAAIDAKVVPGSASVSADGILTVEISIKGENVEAPTSSVLDQIQLSVPLKNEAKVVSDWANVYKKELKAQIDVFLQRNITAKPKLPQTVAVAQALTVKDIDGATVTDPIVVDLDDLSSVDLVTLVTTNVDVEKYGLKYKFDLLDENGVVITYNRGGVNQQKFIEITDAAKGTVQAKKPINVTETCPGRTPIVRVTMYNDQDPNCAVLFGFVKINLTHKPIGIGIAPEKLITNYWYGDKTYIKQNIAVPAVGETDNTKAIFKKDLREVFENDAFSQLVNGWWFEFLPTQPSLGGTVLTVDATGTKLLFDAGKLTEEVVATLSGTNNATLELNIASNKGKELLNKDKEFLKAAVTLKADYCTGGPAVTVDVNGKSSFTVNFIRPINPVANPAEYFVDALNFGDPYTYLEVGKFVNLHDWRLPDAVSAFNTHSNYTAYYGITNIQVIKADIRTDLNQTGGNTVLLSNYPQLEVDDPATVNGNSPAYGFLTYKNNGATLGVEFNLYVPVTITYSWGAITSEVIKVPVKKTIGGSGVKGK